MMALIPALLQKFFSSKTKFRPGDYVSPHKGGPLMIVQSVNVDRKTKSITLNCKWFDNETKSTRSNIFAETQLIPFDWDNP
jgi:uncharacterized protein YodC (DUF2158 family)